MKKEKAITQKDIDAMVALQKSPILLIGKFWGLTPQPLVCAESHEHVAKCYGVFEEGKHITWQQAKVLRAIENGATRISIASGNGIGKSSLLSWLIYWYLFTHFQAQIGCTAPTSDQLYDVLWKELAIWHQKLPDPIKRKFILSSDRVSFDEDPKTWWARARTARKEAPEAFAGLHGNYVMLIGDEGAGIPDEIFTAGEGALTGFSTLVVLTGNPTRLEGVFYDTHHKDKALWTTFQFDGRDSPIVKRKFLDETIAKYGEDSDEFRWKVAGQFPKQEGMVGGWMPLISEHELKYCQDIGSFKNPSLGIDPAGEGTNKTAMVLRDAFMAKVVYLEEKSTQKGVAEKALTFQTHYNLHPQRIVVDNFGEGANIGMEMAAATMERIRAINVGDKADDRERFVNKRAELYWRAREWILKGGQLVNHSEWKQLLTIRYKRNDSGKIVIMSKVIMKEKYGLESPDVADAFSLSFDGDNEAIAGRPRNQLSDSEVASLSGVY